MLISGAMSDLWPHRRLWDGCVARDPYTLLRQELRIVFATLLEGHQQPGTLARVDRSVYGTQDAASMWCETCSEKLEGEGIHVQKTYHH